MAKKKTARKQTFRKKEKPVDIEALEIGLGGLEEVSKDLARVRKNLRKFLDNAEKAAGGFPRRNPTEAPEGRPRVKTGRR